MTTSRPFAIDASPEQETGNTLFIGQSHIGMASVTAADYLVRHLDSTQIGHLEAAELPAIAPFEEGVPRHHSRLYTLDGTRFSVFVGELFVPTGNAAAYTNTLLEWCEEQSIDEVIVLHGVPFPHGPDEHDVFYVATAEYRDRRLGEQSLRPLRGGFLDGVVGELVTRSLDEKAPDTGVFVTPTHPPGPDIEAALRLLDAIENLYALDVDETELRQLGEQMQQYYEQLAERMAAITEGEGALRSHDYPEDRMYM